MPHIPKVGDLVPVQLPDELVQGQVQEVEGTDTLLVTLVRQPYIAKTFKAGQALVCKREVGLLSGNRWVAV